MTEQVINNHHKKTRFFSGRWQLWIIILIPSICVGLATWMYYTGSMIPVGRTNKGTLILPPVALSSLSLKESNGQPFTVKQLQEDWGIFILVGNQCNAQCIKTLDVTERIHIALNKDSDRVRRYALVTSSQEQSMVLPTGFDHMQRLQMNIQQVKARLSKAHIDMSDVSILLVDPLGNIMMSYSKKQSGKDVLKDLQKLLRISNIG